ncbi:uncharacterized protein LOC142235294 [Haematobia irritans]|uniref:uncharacterized protein LOC142235294 n=1 Tax=Haematobia irritans TaxID=7368 RepID=UPI003F500FD4
MNFFIIYTGLLILIQHLQFGFLAKLKTKSIVFKSTEIDFNKEYIGNYTIQLSEDGSNFNSELIYIKDILDSYWIKVSVEMKTANAINYRRIFNYDVDFCNMLGSKDMQSMNIMSMWRQNIMKCSSLPKSCPIRKGSYGWRNFKVDKSSIPAFVMNGVYRVKVLHYIKNYPENLSLINITLNMEITSIYSTKFGRAES